MTILDRYLLLSFAKVFAICFFSLTGLFIVIDAFGNLDEFLRYGPAHGGVLALLASHYGPRALAFFDATSGIMTLMAALFTYTWLQGTNEITALSAAGVRKSRIALPVILAGVVIAGLAVVNREFVLPQFREPLSRSIQDPSGTTAKKVIAQWDQRLEIQINGQSLFTGEKKIEKPAFLLPSSLASLGKTLTADAAYYRPATAERPGGYLLRGGKRLEQLASRASIAVHGDPAILFPSDTSWLAADECFVVSNVSFEQLTGGREWRLYSPTMELVAALANPSLDFGADVRLTVHARLVQPVLDIALLLVGLPFVLGRDGRGIFIAIGQCLLWVGGYFAVLLTFHSLGMKLAISPAFAAWGPLLTLAPVAALVSDPLRNE